MDVLPPSLPKALGNNRAIVYARGGGHNESARKEKGKRRNLDALEPAKLETWNLLRPIFPLL
jgi:hypothetical protein